MRPELKNVLCIKPTIRRSRLMLGFILIFFSALAVRALYLQGYDNIYKSVNQPWLSYTEKLRANRGKITDRRGVPLAISSSVQTVGASPAEITITRAQKAKLAFLLNMTPELLDKRLKPSERDFIYLKRQVSPQKANEIAALKIDGISFESEFKRYYPKGEVTAHVVGLTDIDEKGQEGLELAYHDWLAGKPGKRFVYRDRANNVIDQDPMKLSLPEKGRDLPLSIDLRLQNSAFREIKKAVTENKAKSGSIVVLDAKTGEILALANWPTYNPNNRRTYLPGKVRNLAVVDIFEPGSTLKPFSVAAAIEAGYVTPETKFDIGNGRFRVGNKEITDTHPKKTNLTVTEIIKVSSNVGSAQIALGMPSEKLWQILSMVGFGNSPDSGFPGEASGKLRKFSTWRKIEKATMSFGHGISVSLLQLARAYTIFTTGGKLLPITFVKRDAVPEGRKVLSKTTADAVNHMLAEAIGIGGTGTKAQVLGYQAAGKTGTAHKIADGGYTKDRYYSSFVGFAPVDKPKLIVAVVVDDPKGGKYFGGDVAAPVFSQVVSDSMRILNVPREIIEETITADNDDHPKLVQEGGT